MGLTTDLTNLLCTNLAFSQTCSFDPPDSSKKIKFAFALESSEDSASFDKEILQPKVSLVYANTNAVDARLWNYYVDQTTTTNDCNKTTSTRCYHAGERRKVVLTGITSCSGLTAIDFLGVFKWRCEVTSGVATFYSDGFQDGKGLASLLDATSFKSNSVIISGAPIPLATPYESWWSNTVTAMPAGPDLNTAYAVYTVSGNSTMVVRHLNADGIAIATLGTAILDFNTAGANCSFADGTLAAATSVCMFTVSSQAFVWIEGNFTASAPLTYFVYLYGSKFSRLHRIRATGLGADTPAVSLNTSQKNLITHTRVANGDYPLRLHSSDHNIVDHISLYNAVDDGLYVTGPDNIFANAILAHNETSGLNVANPGNIFLNVHDVGNGTGILLDAGATNTSFQNLLFVSRGSATWDASDVNFNNFIYYTTNASAISIPVGSDNYIFKGKLKLGTNTTYCNIAGAGSNISHDGANNCTTGDGALTIQQGINMSSTFGDKLVAGDTANDDHTAIDAGNGSLLGSAITDLLKFLNDFRVWGQDAANIFSITNYCDVTGDTCAAWDWGIKTGDTVAKAQNSCPTGNSTMTHTWSDSSTTIYLKNAVEFVDDGVGNENGLCESNETCLFSPNIGAYQGHGTQIKSSAGTGCSDISTGGTLTNIKLFEYQTNGY